MVITKILLKYGFGVRSLTFEDFEAACVESFFKCFFTDEKFEDGLSLPFPYKGRIYRVIILRRTLFQNSLAETAWHEFAHAYFEHYGVRAFVRGSEEKYEKAADDFALCCLIPTLWMRTKKWNELLEEGFTDQQITRRKEIYDSTGI